MKILIVDNNLYIKFYPQSFLVKRCLGAKYFFDTKIRVPEELCEADIDVDRVILTGSTAFIRQEKSWMKKERQFIDKWLNKKVPVLGICFGAQLLARHIFGEQSVTALPFPINGSILVEHKENCPIFKGIPNPFGAIATHYEGISAPEKNVIAAIAEWPCYGFSYTNNVYGIQFHPELSGGTGKFLVRLQRYLYDRNVYQDFSVKTSIKHGNRIIRNFIAAQISSL